MIRHFKHALSIVLAFIICLSLSPKTAIAASSPSITIDKVETYSAKTNAKVSITINNPNKKPVSDIAINVTYPLGKFKGDASKKVAANYKPDSKIQVSFEFKKDLGIAVRPTTEYTIVVTAKVDGKAYTAKSGFCSATLFTQITSGDIFFKQASPVTCTLAASTMMLRRKAIILNQVNWETITEANVKKVAWGSNGLNYNFSYSDISVGTVSIKNIQSSEKIQLFKDLLSSHPEGIVIYDHDLPHAVLLTDYDSKSNIFYAADSGSTKNNSRGLLTNTIMTIGGNKTQDQILGGIEQYWYCK